MKTILSFQLTLLNIPNEGGLNCASDGVYIHIGGTDSLSNIWRFAIVVLSFAYKATHLTLYNL